MTRHHSNVFSWKFCRMGTKLFWHISRRIKDSTAGCVWYRTT